LGRVLWYNPLMGLLTHLKNIGLGDKAARVYLAMLELGPASVLEIAAKDSVLKCNWGRLKIGAG